MEQTKLMLKTLAEVFVGACVAQLSAGQTDPKLIFNAGIAAIVVVVGQYVNPKNKAFGSTGK